MRGRCGESDFRVGLAFRQGGRLGQVLLNVVQKIHQIHAALGGVIVLEGELRGVAQHHPLAHRALNLAALAAELCRRTGLAKVFFGNSGAEANEGAIKASAKVISPMISPVNTENLVLLEA